MFKIEMALNVDRKNLHSKIASVPLFDILVVFDDLDTGVVFAMRFHKTVDLLGVIHGLKVIQHMK